MPVTGALEIVKKFNSIPLAVRTRVEDAIREGAVIILEDMKRLTPYDAANPGSHARDGLTVHFLEDGLEARIGLPTRDLESDYFWFRFLDGGTKGGEVYYWYGGAPANYRRMSKTARLAKMRKIKVPARPALRIRERALEGNIDEVRRLVAEAIAQGLREA